MVTMKRAAAKARVPDDVGGMPPPGSVHHPSAARLALRASTKGSMMKSNVPATLELGRVLRGEWASAPEDGVMGAFLVMGPKGSRPAIISMASIEFEVRLEAVNVSVANSPTPNWGRDKASVKDLFWGEDECVVQYHPPRSEYVHTTVLLRRLWKPLNAVILQLPPAILIGPKEKQDDGLHLHSSRNHVSDYPRVLIESAPSERPQLQPWTSSSNRSI